MNEVKEQVYPSVQELMPEVLLAKIPALLAQEVQERYETLGDKYLTNNYWMDGRRINGMMYTNRIDNGIEEIVDAVFCVLGWVFKYTREGMEPPPAAFDSLVGLCEIYSIMKIERAKDELA